MQTHLSEQELVRREKLAQLQTLGIDPYPTSLYPVTQYSTTIKNTFTDDTKDGLADVCLAEPPYELSQYGQGFFCQVAGLAWMHTDLCSQR